MLKFQQLEISTVGLDHQLLILVAQLFFANLEPTMLMMKEAFLATNYTEGVKNGKRSLRFHS